MKKVIITLFFLIAAVFGAQQREFIFIFDTSVNRIALPNVIVDPNSVRIICEQPCEIPNWRFVAENNAVVFAEEVRAGQEINIEYTELFPGISRTYGLNLPVFVSDASASLSDRWGAGFEGSNRSLSGAEAINFEGTKTIGVSVGSNGEVAMEQTLRVEIYGYIDSNTRISAFIDDQSSSLDGQTSEIGELDKIYMKVENFGADGLPRWSAIVGDLEIRSRNDGILNELYTPKGVFLELRNDEIGRKNNVFAGISGTNSGYMRFEPRAGLQGGIYNLTARDGSHVFLIPNSVIVLIDGGVQQEFENYIVDYDLASVRFTAQTPIRSGQIIEIHYKYRNFEYNSFLTGAQNKFSLLDSTLNFDFSFFLDRDIFESSQRDFTRDELELIRNSGNTSPLLMLGNPIHRNDVLRVQAFERIYSLDENGIYQWVANPEDVYLVKDLFTVRFRRTAVGDGDYAPYFPSQREWFLALGLGYTPEFLDEVERAASAVLDFIYLYVGTGNGNYSAFGEVALPSQSVKGEISINYAPSDQLRINIAGAGENFDQNTLSVIGDRHNNSSAFSADLFISSNLENNFVVRNEFTASVAGDLFVNSILDNHELSRNWGIENSIPYSLWENMFSAGFQRNVLLTGGYGRGYFDNVGAYCIRPATTNNGDLGVCNTPLQNNRQLVQRISAGFESGAQTPFDFSYLYTKRTNSESTAGRIQNAGLGFDFGDNRLNFFAREDWFLNEAQYYNGRIEAGITHRNEFRRFSNSFTYNETGTSQENSHFSRTRTLHSLAFSSALTTDFSRNRTLTSSGSFIYEETREGSSSTFLLTLEDRVVSDDHSKGINTTWNLSSESRNERRWEYIRVPSGTGTHIRDPIFGGFTESPFGDYVAREIVVSGGNALDFFVRNNFSVNWHYNMRNGLSFSGFLLSEGDVRHDRNNDLSAPAWLIYLPFAANINDDLREKISHSLISYNQHLSVMPPEIPIRASARLGASTSISPQRNRRVLEEETNFLYMWERFHLGFSNKGFIEETDGGNITLLIRDINIKPLQTFVARDWLNIFLEETFGRTVKNNSGNYTAARGGFRFLPTNAGSAEISYTYAYVNFDGELRHNMADGFAVNGNHRISANLGIRASNSLRFSGFVRGDKNRNTSQDWRFSASINAEIAIN